MELKRIIGACLANAFRSPNIDANIKAQLERLGVKDIEATGRGVKADFWSEVVAGTKKMENKYIQEAANRALKFPENYSENVTYLAKEINLNKPTGTQKITLQDNKFSYKFIFNTDIEEVARLVIGEERQAYKNIISRYCEEIGIQNPSGYHRQLTDKDLKDSHIIVASDKERALIDLPDNRITVLGIQDVLGGTYKDKKPVMEEIKFKVEQKLPKILEMYL